MASQGDILKQINQIHDALFSRTLDKDLSNDSLYSSRRLIEEYFDILYQNNFDDVYGVKLVSIVRYYIHLLDKFETEPTDKGNATELTKQLLGYMIDKQDYILSNYEHRTKLLDEYYALRNLIDDSTLAALKAKEENTVIVDSFDGFYRPEVSDKESAIDLISKAVDLIKNSDNFSEKAKTKIINQLEDILKELKSDNTNWPIFWYKLRHTVLILGAIGSFASGGVGISQILQARENLKKAGDTIQNTSISFNIKNINQMLSEPNQIDTAIEIQPHIFKELDDK